jgi:Protein of unknown function (DUF1549)/Protein of unknown function (DUF1553)
MLMKTTLLTSLTQRAVMTLTAMTFAVSFCATAAPDQSIETLDRLIEEGLTKAQIKPNAAVTDETFLRRIYLDIIGRVPTQTEAQEFITSSAADKRARLIDQLLNSEGYADHFFTLWADVLRVKSTPGEGQNENGAGEPYAAWVKEQLKKNTNYRDFVKGLLTANGYLWDNGAVGYYMRDRGMPFDNMSNTVQVFLGTRLACAQCHNHPFDKWTQIDYYEMAAYTYGMETSLRPEDLIPGMERKSRKEKKTALANRGQAFRDALDDLLEPLAYGAHYNEKKALMLPNEFKVSKEGKPGDELKRPQPVFNDIFKEKIKTNKHQLENYADWVTDPDNPTFTLMIVNRLWKQAMGFGLIEPVDDIMGKELDEGKDPFQMATNPAVLRHLANQMKAVNYDMKKFLKIVYNSKSYQREAQGGEVDPDKYLFQGPILRRLTAEQVWDSFVTFVIPNPDQRTVKNGYSDRMADMKVKAMALKEKLEVGNGKAILDLAAAIAAVEEKFNPQLIATRKDLNDARMKNDKAGVKAANLKLEEIEAAKFDAAAVVQRETEANAQKSAGSGSIFGQKKKEPAMMEKKDAMAENTEKADETTDAWQGYDKKWVRASELPQPAPGGHFLREWGQADRDIIQNSHRDASVTQALAMLNSGLFDELSGPNTILGKTIAAGKTTEEKRDTLFLTVLARHPNEQEKAVVAKQVAADGAEAALKKVAWGLINTQEFLFVR